MFGHRDTGAGRDLITSGFRVATSSGRGRPRYMWKAIGLELPPDGFSYQATGSEAVIDPRRSNRQRRGRVNGHRVQV